MSNFLSQRKMKYLTLILSLLAYTTAIYAQNPRIETFGDRRTETYLYKLGQDSIRFTIRGKADTLQTTQFYRNGRPSDISWKRDSNAAFDVLGRKRYQNYGISKGEKRADSSFIFYPNGQIFEYIRYDENTSLRKIFKENGELISISEAIRTITGNSVTTKNKEGVAIASYRTDTVKKSDPISLLMFDTIFHANGRLAQIAAYENFLLSTGTRYFDKSGKLIYTGLTDADRLTQFKDNVDCYYGLKNHRNDTIVKPRFDLIEQNEDMFFTAYTGESAILLDNKGAPMTPPVDRLSKVGRLREHHDAGFAEKQASSQITNTFLHEKINEPKFFMFQTGKNYGVMDEKGRIIMPPQYLPSQFRYVGDGDYFDFQESIKDSVIRNGFLNRQGKTIFDKPILNTRYSNFEDYFFIGKRLNFDNNLTRHILWVQKNQFWEQGFDISEKNSAGLGKGDGTVILPMKFSGIERVPKTSLFITTLIKANPRTKKFYFQEGIFDVHRQKWLLDTLNFSVNNIIEDGFAFFVIRNLTTQKYGIMDTMGKYIVPLSYDSIGITNHELGLFWVKKGDKFQILTIENGKAALSKTKYGFLAPTHFNLTTSSGYQKLTYFIAQINGKWGVIDAKEQVIKAFEYDYAAQGLDNLQYFLLVKNNKVEYFDLESLPNETDLWISHFHNKSGKKNVVSYPIFGNTEGVFFVNDAGKVVIPPQYKPLDDYFSDKILLVENAKKQKKIIYLETSKVVDYPFNYDPKLADANSQVIGVYDTASKSYGVVSTEGKVLVPCVNYGIAIGDVNNSAFFVKRDTFAVPEDYFLNQGLIYTQRRYDTLSLEDNDWLLYDGNGKIANTTPFRYPIDFKKGIGAGMQTNGFQLFNSDGTVLTPFEKNKENGQKTGKNTEGSNSGFTNIWREPKLGFYALFKNQGLTPTLILTKENGEILIPSGQFDGISKFYDKYALVTASGKVGLIDSFGRTIIAPQDLRSYEGQFMDSLDLCNVKNREKEVYDIYSFYEQIPQPISFGYDNKWHPDSLDLSPSQRRILWNLMLEKCINNTIITASEVSIAHAPLKATSLSFYTDGHFNGDLQVSPQRIVMSEKTTAFCFRSHEDYSDEKSIFYNFYRRDNRWEELKINDLLQIQGEKRWLMNDFITKKVKALKDQQIDCSNAEAFIGQVENRFMLTREGIDFCFKSTGNSIGTFVIIPFTWAELTPFLKMKIF
jgi:antitoxin component YwqK of YwqJK toxin-antitoxin module